MTPTRVLVVLLASVIVVFGGGFLFYHLNHFRDQVDQRVPYILFGNFAFFFWLIVLTFFVSVAYWGAQLEKKYYLLIAILITVTSAVGFKFLLTESPYVRYINWADQEKSYSVCFQDRQHSSGGRNSAGWTDYRYVLARNDLGCGEVLQYQQHDLKGSSLDRAIREANERELRKEK